MKRFSRRMGFDEINTAEITIRNDAPSGIREAVISIAYEIGFSPSSMRRLICHVLRKLPDPGNWSEYPNIADEVVELIYGCEWYEVYDIIEEIYKVLEKRQEPGSNFDEIESKEYFVGEINRYFLKAGIGWKLSEGEIQIRGTEIFEETIKNTTQILLQTKRYTASGEIHQALADLSCRPNPDITGAIQHALAALECVARDITGEPKSTLGEILKKNPTLIPAPLDTAIHKVWGYASEHGRHLREGRLPEMEEAELLVGIVSVVVTYLSRKKENI